MTLVKIRAGRRIPRRFQDIFTKFGGYVGFGLPPDVNGQNTFLYMPTVGSRLLAVLEH